MLRVIPNRFLLVLALSIGCVNVLVGDLIDPIDSGKSALRDTRPPWYDAEADAVRIVSLETETQAGERQDWRKPKRPDWEWDWDWDWLDWWPGSSSGAGGSNFRFPSFEELLQSLGWILLFLLLGALVYMLVRTYLKLEQKVVVSPHRGDTKAEEIRTDEQRIRDLPIQPSKKKGDFLSMAKEFHGRGQYAEAIVYLFSHRLIQLDRAGLIRLTRGKTNRQYLYETNRSPLLREILGETIHCFEDVFFGKHHLSKERFESTWRDNETFETIIQKVQG